MKKSISVCRKPAGIVLLLVLLMFVFTACHTSRRAPSRKFRKKKDCGCGTWSAAPQQPVYYVVNDTDD